MTNLEPKALWTIFHEITQIPRPSKKEERIRAYLIDFAAKHNLVCKTDKAGNVLISKPATPGYENEKTIILQSHMDMVCEKNNETVHNFDTDAIQTYIDGDWVKARGTTLGADNGIGMALSLAVVAANDLQHPAIECLITVDEETGLTGAFALENDFMHGEVLINLDSEDDGEVFVGCAGGIDTTAIFSYNDTPTPEGLFCFRVTVKGLLGGHSGDDINRNRGNAIKILARYMYLLQQKMTLYIQQIDGGNLRNAIAREASATLLVPYAEKETVRVLLNIFIAEIEGEMLDVEPKLALTLESDTAAASIIDNATSTSLLRSLYACPHGVIGMSRDMPGLVETSTNLASVKMRDGHQIVVTTSQRSSVETAKHDIANMVETVFLLAGASVTHGDGYPGWKPNLKSVILQKTIAAYAQLFGAEPKARAIHAGLECGLFLEKYPHLDMVSFGPQMYGVHSPDERLSIRSTQKCWEWLVAVLAAK